MPESSQYDSPAPTLLDAEQVQRPIASIEVALQVLAEAGIDTVMMQDGPLLVGAAKLAITQSEARYRHLINQIGGFVAELRLSGEVVYANEALVRLLKCDAHELQGSNFFNQLHKVHVSPRLDNFHQLFAEKRELIDFRTDLQGSASSVITVAWYMAHIAGGSASQGRAFLLGLDITAKVRAEDEVRIASIAFDSQEGMVVTDAAGAILRVNKAFTDITGYTADDVSGKNSRLLQSNRQDADFFKGMWKSILETSFWQGEIWNRRKSGEVYPSWLTITAVKAADGSVLAYVGAFLDITHRKAADSQIAFNHCSARR
jgi:PAS domain S-box-containing protein